MKDCVNLFYELIYLQNRLPKQYWCANSEEECTYVEVIDKWIMFTEYVNVRRFVYRIYTSIRELFVLRTLNNDEQDYTRNWSSRLE